MVLRPEAIETLFQGRPFERVEPVADGFVQLLQSFIGKWVSFEQKCDAAIVLCHMSDILQHGGQSESVVTGARGEHHGSSVRFEFRLFVESPRKDFRAVTDEICRAS